MDLPAPYIIIGTNRNGFPDTFGMAHGGDLERYLATRNRRGDSLSLRTLIQSAGRTEAGRDDTTLLPGFT